MIALSSWGVTIISQQICVGGMVSVYSVYLICAYAGHKCTHYTCTIISVYNILIMLK